MPEIHATSVLYMYFASIRVYVYIVKGAYIYVIMFDTQRALLSDDSVAEMEEHDQDTYHPVGQGLVSN